MKFSNQLVISSLAVLFLSACANDAAERRQAKDDFKYLDTPQLEPLKSSDEVQLEIYPNYQLPQGDYVGGVGREVDIRPPQQVLELIPGARTENNNGVITLWLVREEEVQKVWETAESLVSSLSVPVREQSDKRIETDWFTWNYEDEVVPVSSRHVLEQVEQNNRFGFRVELVEWKEAQTVMPVSVTNRERYNAFMTNIVTSTYDQRLREEALAQAQELVKTIPISMGKDRSGLPVIIARAEYEVFWQQIPEILPAMGFELEERIQSQGTVKAKFKQPDDVFWEEVGVKPLSFENKSYTFLFGDLGNRTSINITDNKGIPVTEEILEELVPVIVHLLAKQ
jgi:outer membrane protein assembly factor BamC